MLVGPHGRVVVITRRVVGEIAVVGEMHGQLDGLPERRPHGQHEETRDQPGRHARSLDPETGFVKPRLRRHLARVEGNGTSTVSPTWVASRDDRFVQARAAAHR